jgi:hypothetical protein
MCNHDNADEKEKGETFKVSPFSFVRPAGRIHLEVKVLYDPGRGNR